MPGSLDHVQAGVREPRGEVLGDRFEILDVQLAHDGVGSQRDAAEVELGRLRLGVARNRKARSCIAATSA